MGCFTWLVLVAASVLLLVSVVRWFEQLTDAVEQRQWSRAALLIVVPPCTWLFPSRVSAGRPTAVPHHEPVRGFGKVSLEMPVASREDQTQPAAQAPPPGTPAEFIGLPNIPMKKPSSRPAVDPDKLARLKQKMREQGMLDDDQ
jgi:hypothetical protein